MRLSRTLTGGFSRYYDTPLEHRATSPHQHSLHVESKTVPISGAVSSSMKERVDIDIDSRGITPSPFIGASSIHEYMNQHSGPASDRAPGRTHTRRAVSHSSRPRLRTHRSGDGSDAGSGQLSLSEIDSGAYKGRRRVASPDNRRASSGSRKRK